LRVAGYDVSPPAMEKFRDLGGIAASSVADVATDARIILTSLPSAKALFDVVAELKQVARDGSIVAETSTFALADKIVARDRLAEAGIAMLDCPLSGTGNQALVRDVLVYGSGERQDYDRCLPVFNAFSRAPHYLGPFGNGSKMKYVANLMVAVHTAVAGEAFTLARKAGIDPAKMFEVIRDGAAGSRSLDARGEMLVADTYLPVRTMPLELWRKDMRVIADFANSLACPTPMFSAAVPLFNAAVASGFGEHDTAAVAMVIEAMAGLPVNKNQKP
jgi:L-threonate 2-dehydrogenase